MFDALTKDGEKIFEKLHSFTGFYLAGGTALALQISHRISVDFDFFSPEAISQDLLSEVEKIFIGSRVQVSVNNSDELTVFVDGIKVTFLRYPFKVYRDFVEDHGLKIITPKTIALTKAYSIGRRGSYKDYVDLYFLLDGDYVSLEDIVQDCQKIFDAGFNDRLFLEQLVYMKDISEIEVNFLRNKVAKEEMEKFFIKKVEDFKVDLI